MGKEITLNDDREIVRQELNIEKWPLFAPSTFRKKWREINREVILENGDRIKRKVTIGKTPEGATGVLRIVDYKVFCALIALWEEKGRPLDKKVNFAIHELAEKLKL